MSEKTASTTAFSMSQHSSTKTKATKPRYKVLVGRPGRIIPKLSPIMLFPYSWKYLVLFSELSSIIPNYSWRTN